MKNLNDPFFDDVDTGGGDRHKECLLEEIYENSTIHNLLEFNLLINEDPLWTFDLDKHGMYVNKNIAPTKGSLFSGMLKDFIGSKIEGNIADNVIKKGSSKMLSFLQFSTFNPRSLLEKLSTKPDLIKAYGNIITTYNLENVPERFRARILEELSKNIGVRQTPEQLKHISENLFSALSHGSNLSKEQIDSIAQSIQSYIKYPPNVTSEEIASSLLLHPRASTYFKAILSPQGKIRIGTEELEKLKSEIPALGNESTRREVAAYMSKIVDPKNSIGYLNVAHGGTINSTPWQDQAKALYDERQNAKITSKQALDDLLASKAKHAEDWKKTAGELYKDKQNARTYTSAHGGWDPVSAYNSEKGVHGSSWDPVSAYNNANNNTTGSGGNNSGVTNGGRTGSGGTPWYQNPHSWLYIAVAGILAVTAIGVWFYMRRKTLEKVMNDPKMSVMEKIRYCQNGIEDAKKRLAKAKNASDKEKLENQLKAHEDALRKLQNQK